MILEVCVTNIQSAITAQRAGAHRIELCVALDTGGLTPSKGLLQAVRRQLQIPVNVLIRPREGNFCYSSSELEIILADIRICREAGANGVVIGAADQTGQLHREHLEAMLEAAGPLDVTCHRVFDFTPDPFEALETLIELGIPRVLSSGQAASAHAGRLLLQRLAEQAKGRISIMPGAGLTPSNIQEVARTTGATEFHLTGREKVMQPNTGVHIPGLEWGYWESTEVVLRQVLKQLEQV
ncbi:MAG: copper homeostasis protein CutC [Bacteroidetes bacterium]|nr:MAG: copper homeostasis protein CutC [Bacteroidota bacterium]